MTARADALAALDRIDSATREWSDHVPPFDGDLALVRAALTPAPLPVDLAAIQERADAATPGPWKFQEADEPQGFDAPGAERFIYAPYYPMIIEDADADFIAHARTDVPALVAELAELRARPTLTAEEARAALYAIEYPWRCETDGGPDEDAVNALRAIAEGAGS